MGKATWDNFPCVSANIYIYIHKHTTQTHPTHGEKERRREKKEKKERKKKERKGELGKLNQVRRKSLLKLRKPLVSPKIQFMYI